jgi:DNA-binding transcriptional ArsR family regulator
MAITKALADEQRVRVLQALQRGEVCVCQIVEMLGLATSTVSKHMSILKQARLVDSRKEGRWMYYRLAGDEAPEVVRQAIAWIASSLAGDPQVQRDRQQLAAICNSDPHELCVTQGCGKSARS